MIDVPIFNQSGKKVSSFQLDEAKLGGEVNRALLKQALVMYHANQRQGSVRTLARGEVAGSTRKMFRQKGTGNARTGGIRNPIKKGGGHAKQKRPKDWRQAMPKKARQLATKSAILSKLQSNDVRVVDAIKLDGAKTKPVAAMFKALGIDRSVLFARIAARFDEMLRRGFVDEVGRLRARGDLHAGLPSMRLIGYRQLWQHLAGESTLEEASEKAIAATRQLARRQLTWLRAEPGADWYDAGDSAVAERIVARVAEWLDERRIPAKRC